MSVVQKMAPVALIAATMALIPPMMFADTYFDHGVMLFGKKQWNQALPYFHKAAEDSPWDSSAAYYEALCYHQMRDWNNAKACYKGIIEHFPGSPAYANALAALKVLDPAFVKQHESGTPAPAAASSASSGGDSSSDMAALLAKVVVTAPSSEQKIPVRRELSKAWVDGSINGRTMKLDFSGDATTISSKDAKAMNLAVSGGKAICTVKVGQISEQNFPVTVEDTVTPKLGTDFFNQFSYTLEPSNLVATKKSGGSSGGSSWDVPFRKKGKDMVIDIQVNGRRVSVVLDPDGGESVVPKSRTREFGLDASESATLNKFDAETNPNGPLRGQAGYGEVKEITSAEGKVVIGPCSSQVRFKIDDKATDAKVTPSVFGSWKYQIDPSASKLHFSH